MQEPLREFAAGGAPRPAASGAGRPAPAERRRRHERRRRRERGAEVVFFPPRPRRARTVEAAGLVHPAALAPEADRVGVGVLAVAVRFAALIAAAGYLLIAIAWDRLTFDWRGAAARERKATRTALLMQRRAVRLRRILQRWGGTFIKVGQQLAIRADVLPPVYCQELEQLLDEAPAIPEAHVRAVLERKTGKPLGETFVLPFDFRPIGSASIACVYRARLLSGEVVAVKVRRPNIVRAFKADLAALDWLLGTAEFLTLWRPGFTATLRSELRLMLLEELDFRIEVRYQELFRRYLRKRKKLKTTAPKLHFDLCGHEVIVSEFVAGVWMKDLMAGVESGDRAYLDALRELDIDPEKVARQLIRGSHYAFFECPFFHGDPHPGNIAIQPGNRIVMVDFGACGVFAERERHHLSQLHYYQAREDVGGMVRCVINLMEPLPPIDLDGFRRALEDAWWKGYYGIKSRHAKWWERTSFRLWSALLGQVHEYAIPLPLNVLRMIRATLLYDTVAARIYPRIDVFKEYRIYHHEYAERVKERMQRSFWRQFLCGVDAENYVLAREVWDTGNVLIKRLRSFLQKPLPSFKALVDKGYEVAMLIVSWVYTSILVTALAFGVGAWRLHRRLGELRLWHYPAAMIDLLRSDMSQPGAHAAEIIFGAWLVLMVLTAAKYIRRIRFRLCDRDIHGESRFQ
jgi:predicted unusual protein kinase regulating ubiquinone biosynthesis (AarF/ABC1/UbiB family)